MTLVESTHGLVSLMSTCLFPVPHEEMCMVPLDMAYQWQNAGRHQKQLLVEPYIREKASSLASDSGSYSR